jgi:hypothetical protein
MSLGVKRERAKVKLVRQIARSATVREQDERRLFEREAILARHGRR